MCRSKRFWFIWPGTKNAVLYGGVNVCGLINTLFKTFVVCNGGVNVYCFVRKESYSWSYTAEFKNVWWSYMTGNVCCVILWGKV